MVCNCRCGCYWLRYVGIFNNSNVAIYGITYNLAILLEVRIYFSDLVPENGAKVAKLGEMIKIAAKEDFPVNHPDFDYPGPDILAFVSEKTGKHVNSVVMTNGKLDWSDPESFKVSNVLIIFLSCLCIRPLFFAYFQILLFIQSLGNVG